MKPAENQSENKSENELEVIQLSNGQSAILISPKMSEQLAVVDLKTLKRIIQRLEYSDIHLIKRNIIDKIKSLEDNCSIENFVNVLKYEVNFHETVNIINTIELNK